MESKEMKLVLIGNTSVGKTCVVKKATTGVFAEDSVATLGASYVSKLMTVGNVEVRLQVWDTAGQERYRGMTPMYFRGAHAAIIVYSVIDIDSFNGVDQWVESLRENASSDIIIYLCGNKVDIDERDVTTANGQAKADAIGAQFYEVSAKTGYGIEDLFNDIPRAFLDKFGKGNTAAAADGVKIEEKSGKKKKCCK